MTLNQKKYLIQQMNKLMDKKELEEKLIHQHYGLVISQALSFLDEDNRSNLEDYIQVGLIALLKAIRKYDETKSKFSTFASLCIRNEFLNHKRKDPKRKNPKIIYDTNLMNSFVGEQKYLDKDKIIDLIPDYLSSNEKFILQMKLENHTNKEIAEELHCSKRVIDSKLKHIIQTLRDANE